MEEGKSKHLRDPESNVGTDGKSDFRGVGPLSGEAGSAGRLGSSTAEGARFAQRLTQAPVSYIDLSFSWLRAIDLLELERIPGHS